MKYTHVIWDIDNTVLDTEEELLSSLSDTLKEKYGIERSEEELWFAMVMSARETVRCLGVPEGEKLWLCWNRRKRNYQEKVTVFSGVEEALIRLRGAGVHLGIITARTQEEYRQDFITLGLERYFETVLCADSTQRQKPDAEPVDRYRALTGVEKGEILMVGDSASDMQCCRAAGICGGLALWGKKVDLSVPADYHFSTPAAVATAVLESEG